MRRRYRWLIYRLAIHEIECDPKAGALLRNMLNQLQLGASLDDYVPHFWTE